MLSRGVHLSPWGCGFTGSLLTGVAKAPATELKSRGCLTPCFHLRSGPLRPVSERCSFFWQELRGKSGRHDLEPRPSNPALAFEIMPSGSADLNFPDSTNPAAHRRSRAPFLGACPSKHKNGARDREIARGNEPPNKITQKSRFQPRQMLTNPTSIVYTKSLR
jgi:hypothetical protein